jgi:DNA-binding MarR family transcriptional regulator
MIPFQNNRSRPSTLETVLRLHGFFRHRLHPLGVSPVQAGMLLYLDRHPQCEVSELASALCIQNLLAVKIVQLLQRDGWICKSLVNAKRKTVKLQLTKKGTALARKINANIIVTDNLFGLADNRTAA